MSDLELCKLRTASPASGTVELIRRCHWAHDMIEAQAARISELEEMALQYLLDAGQWCDLTADRDALRAENERQAGFINEIMQRWPWGDIDGFDLQDIAVKYGMLTEVEGGFDPDIHEDPTGACDRGDSFFLRTYKRPAPPQQGD